MADETLKQAGIAAALDVAALSTWEWLKKKFRGVSDAVTEEAKRRAQEHVKTVTEKWVEMDNFIQTALKAEDPVAAANINKYWNARQFHKPREYGEHKPYKPGSEQMLRVVLCNIYFGLSEPHEIGDRVERFRNLGHLGPEEFDAEIDRLTNDWLEQILKRCGWEIKVLLEGPTEELVDDVWLTANRVGRASDQLRDICERKPWTISNLLFGRRS